MADQSAALSVEVEQVALSKDDERKLNRLLKPAQAGDEKALAEIRPIIEKSGLWPYLGDLNDRVQSAWLDAMVGRNKLVREAYERKAAELRRELLAAGDSPLERLLTDRIVLTWLQVCQADTAYASALKGDGHSFKQGTYLQEGQDRTNARHLKAVKALASVRRLLAPSVQINVARNQIISQGGPPVAGPATEA